MRQVVSVVFCVIFFSVSCNQGTKKKQIIKTSFKTEINKNPAEISEIRQQGEYRIYRRAYFHPGLKNYSLQDKLFFDSKGNVNLDSSIYCFQYYVNDSLVYFDINYFNQSIDSVQITVDTSIFNKKLDLYKNVFYGKQFFYKVPKVYIEQNRDLFGMVMIHSHADYFKKEGGYWSPIFDIFPKRWDNK